MFSIRKTKLILVLLVATDAFCTNSSPSKPSRVVLSSTLKEVTSASKATTLGSKTPEEQSFLDECQRLCDERNLPLEEVLNCRDLASANHSPILPNRIYRTGHLSDATEKDCKLLMQERGIKTIVDLRSGTELKEDESLQREAVFRDFTTVVWKGRGRAREGCVTVLGENERPLRKRRFIPSQRRNPFNKLLSFEGEGEDLDYDDDCTIDLDDELCDPEEEQDCVGDAVPEKNAISPAGRKERHFVSIMNQFKYVQAVFRTLRKRDIARLLLGLPPGMLSRRLKTWAQKPILRKINDGGLPMLNELLLSSGAPGIRHVLDICADRSRHPVALHCTAGKDRTGIISAILLAFVGVPDEDVVQDYSLSANVYAEIGDHKAKVAALNQRDLDPKTFLGAPPQVMADTLKAIREDYGSIEGYMDWIGFGKEDQDRLRNALLN